MFVELVLWCSQLNYFLVKLVLWCSQLSYFLVKLVLRCSQLFVFIVELVILDHYLNCFALGLGHTCASCPDNLQVLSADYNLVVVPAIYSLLILLSNEVDGQTLGIVSLALFLWLTKQDWLWNDAIKWVIALQEGDVKHVSCYRINQHKLGKWAVHSDVEWTVACVVVWNCLSTPKSQLTRVSKPVDAVELLSIVEYGSRWLVIPLTASINHCVTEDFEIVTNKRILSVYLLDSELYWRWRQLSFHEFKTQHEW